jgi:hypothetical protein
MKAENVLERGKGTTFGSRHVIVIAVVREDVILTRDGRHEVVV